LRGVDGDAHGVGDAVTDEVRVAAERTDAERGARLDLAEHGAVGELVLPQLRLDETERELGPVDRHAREVA